MKKEDYLKPNYEKLYYKLYSEVACMLLYLPEEGLSRVELLHSWDSLRRVFDRVTYDK